MFSIDGKICLVTGASRGLGAHFVRLLLDRGAIVIGVSNSVPDWDASPYADCFDYVRADLREADAVARIFDHIEEKYARLDVAINNAGLSRVERARDFDADGFKELLSVNVIAAGLVAKNAARLMRGNSDGGSIINITSVMADATITGLSGYAATKAALEHLTRSMAAEWARHLIRVNNLAPGWFPTEMTDSYLKKGLGQLLNMRIPMSRLGALEELDGACLLLASDASRYMTGSTLVVDGGFSIIN